MKFGRVILAATLAITALFISTKPAGAADTIRLYYLTLPGLMESDGKSGPIADILHEICIRSSLHFDMKHMNMNRMIRALQTEEPAAGVPQLGAMIRERFGQKMRISPPIVFRFDYAFVRKGTTIPRSVSDMKHMVLVHSPMTTLPPPLRGVTGLMTLETHSDASALSLLASGRADLWVNDETTTRTAMANAGVDNIAYDPTEPFYVWPAHMVYSPTLDQAIVARINAALLSMANDGTLKAHLPRNYAEQYEASYSYVPASN